MSRPSCGAPRVPATCAPVAQLDRAPDYESGGQRFESFRARHSFLLQRLAVELQRMRTGLSILPLAALAACSSTGGPYPSLQPRAAEAIDPRVEVERPINDRPVRASIAPAIAHAEQLASAAGAPQSESWIAAQEALSAAIAARKPTATALGDIDALGASKL